MRKLITLLFCFSALLGFSQSEDLDNLTIQLAFQKPDTSKVITSLQIIKLLYHTKDYNKALQFIRESEKLSNDLNYDAGIAEITYYKALIFAKKEDYINAIDYYTKSKDLYIALADTLGVAKINNSIGLIEIARGNYDKGLQFSLSAIDVLEKRDLKEELCDAYRNLATAYHKMEAYDQAITFYKKTLDLEESLGKEEEIIQTNKNLGDLYYNKKEFKKALYYFNSVLTSIDTSDTVLRGDVLTKIGSSYLSLNNLDQAKEYITQGLRLNRRLNNDKGTLIGLNTAGELYLREKKPIVAERLLYEATTLGRALEDNEQLIINYGLRAKLDSVESNFKLAYIWQKRYFELKNDVEKQKQQASTKKLEKEAIVVPVEIKDLNSNNNAVNQALIDQHQEEKKANKEEIKRLNIIFYSMLLALLVVSTFLILIYLKRNNRIKYTKDLEDKNKQINIQNIAILDQTKNLEDINKVKDKLFSIVSHDLKDSLTSIKGFIDLLKDGSLSKEEFNHLIPELSENANNASLLLFNLLNWSNRKCNL
ncbi:tetratricopeptide repeat protein [Lacinutrix himadriensis]|uniref:tetratricopeptide repeat protein n=1 Tax=Lacinutrix himadriensis TaxID=641549 RepID=UPI000A63A498|nr:tetratricopeptide repeat protein [Lacinutrix himadriensis]